MRAILLLAAVLTGCAHYAGIAVAPNGTVWVATNTGGGTLGEEAHGIYACIVRGVRLECMRMQADGLP